MFSLVDRSEWPALEISGEAQIILGDVGRAIALGKKKLQLLAGASNTNEASTKMLKNSIEFLERVQSGGTRVVSGVLQETKYPNVSFTEVESGKKIFLHKINSEIRHAAFEGVSGDASNNTMTCYSLDMTWAAQQLYKWLNRHVLGNDTPNVRRRRAAIGGFRGHGSMDNYYTKGKNYTTGSVKATNLWFNARMPPMSNAYLWVTHVERYRIVLGLLCKDCGATSPTDLMRLCGVTGDVSRFVNGVPIRLAEELDDIDPNNIPVDLQPYIGVESTGFYSKLPYADPVAVILTAAGHVGSSPGYASNHVAKWKATSNAPHGYYEFEDFTMHIEDNLTDVLSSTPNQGRLGVLTALSQSDRELSGNMQVFLDTVRLFILRQVVQELKNLRCHLSVINGDGVYFYASRNLATELAQVLPGDISFTFEYHSGGPSCTKSTYWIQEGASIQRADAPCKHRYITEIEVTPKRRRKLKDDIDFSKLRAEDFQGKRLSDITFTDMSAQIQGDWDLPESEKMPAFMPFVRLCKLVAEAYDMVNVQRCYMSAGVRKTAEEPHVSGLHGHGYHQLSATITTANMPIPVANGASITFQLLMQGTVFDSSWNHPFERLLSSNTSHKALEAKFVAWSMQGRPVVDIDSIRDAHLGPDFVLPTRDEYYDYSRNLPDVPIERRIYPIVLHCNNEASSPDWPYFVSGQTYKIFCDSGFDSNSIRAFEEELREFHTSSAGFTHEAWGTLLPLALSAIRRTDLISDYFLVSKLESGYYYILKDDFGDLCRRPVSAIGIGLQGKRVVVPELLVKYLTGDTVDDLEAGNWDDLQESLQEIMTKYPKGIARYEWLQAYFDSGMDEDFFEVPMASDVVKLLNMFFGMSLGQHFVLDKVDEVKPWFIAYGEPKSGKGVAGSVLQKLIPETSIIVPDQTAFAAQQFFRSDGRLMWTCKVPDPTGPLYNTLDFRRFDHGGFSTNVKNRDFQTATTASGEHLPVPTGNIDLNDCSLIIRPSATVHDLKAIARRTAPYRYTTSFSDEQPEKYAPDPILKQLPGLDEPRLVILVRNCFHRLRVEMEMTGKSIVNIYPEIADGTDEPVKEGYLIGKQQRLIQDIRNQQSKMDNIEEYVLEGLEECPGTHVLVDKLYDEIEGTFSRKIRKRQFYRSLVDVAGQLGAMVQVQHRSSVALCLSGGISVHVHGPHCCPSPVLSGETTHRIITNCKWVS